MRPATERNRGLRLSASAKTRLASRRGSRRFVAFPFARVSYLSSNCDSNLSRVGRKRKKWNAREIPTNLFLMITFTPSERERERERSCHQPRPLQLRNKNIKNSTLLLQRENKNGRERENLLLAGQVAVELSNIIFIDFDRQLCHSYCSTLAIHSTRCFYILIFNH